MKFAGLFIIVITLFLMLGLFPSVYLSLAFKQKDNSFRIDQITPHKFNEEINRGKKHNSTYVHGTELAAN